MSHPFAGLHFHIVLRTRMCAPPIDDAVAAALAEQARALIRGLGGTLVAVGAVPDHVHLLAHVGPHIGLSKFVETLKQGCARLATTDAHIAIDWQEGYCAFMVCARDVERVAAYIGRQKELHRFLTYNEELRQLRRGLPTAPAGVTVD